MKKYTSIKPDNSTTTNMNANSSDKQNLMSLISQIVTISENENNDKYIDGIELLADAILIHNEINRNAYNINEGVKKNVNFEFSVFIPMSQLLEQYVENNEDSFNLYLESKIPNIKTEILSKMAVYLESLIKIDKYNYPAKLILKKITEN